MKPSTHLRESLPRRRRLTPGGAWFILLSAFAVLTASGLYLGVVTALRASSGIDYEDYVYQLVFLGHLGAGLLVCLPLLWFAAVHISRAWSRINAAAKWLGFSVLLLALLLLLSGLLISRFEIFDAISPILRERLYWLHLATALAMLPLFWWHRRSGRRRIDWRVGRRVALATTAFAMALGAAGWALGLLQPVPQVAVANAPNDFALSLAKTVDGGLLDPSKMMVDDYCQDCHADTHRGWLASAHRFSSFNNPAYAFSVRELRQQLIDEGKPLSGVMFCAACHDPVPLFAGFLRDPAYDDVNHPTASAGVNCLACHAMQSVDSARGNGDYTIAEPQHYPFAFSGNPWLAGLSRQLIRAKPALHKRTFLKDFHRSSEFCSTCHKVFLPESLNAYKWLRGQNHYDAFLLSGVSGHGVASFYYPPKAQENCNGCHMPADAAPTDLAANPHPEDGSLVVPDHAFAAANTGIWPLMGIADPAGDKREAFLRGALRVDLFGLRDGAAVDAPLIAPLRPQLPVLQAGRPYLLETVLRTVRLGHLFTQGTADSNEIWVQLQVRHQGRLILASGELDAAGAVDPWSHFVNVYMLDREGRRIDRRNVRDIFVPLYNNQIPPGAADVLHYLLQLPEGLSGTIDVEARLWYRKFDATYVRHIRGDDGRPNDLPMVLIASDRLQLYVASAGETPPPDAEPTSSVAIPEWERWNDYGIGLLRKRAAGGRSQLRQAGEAFAQLEALGRAEGALNAARVHLVEGDVDAAAAALRRASEHPQPAYPWSIAWFSGQVQLQRGEFEQALQNFHALESTDFAEARARGFDFSLDYNLLNEIGKAYYELARQRRSSDGSPDRDTLHEAANWFGRSIAIDAENLIAHFNLAQIHQQLGNEALAAHHRQMHAMVKPDENAIERAVTRHRAANPAADHAAEAVVVYRLRPPNATLAEPVAGAQR